ncbi:hypothetical protein [Streptomyces sp. NPDC060322]
MPARRSGPTHPASAATARYVKLQFTAGGTGRGYSLHDFGVHS